MSSDNKERAAETHPSGQFEDREKGHRREVKDHWRKMTSFFFEGKSILIVKEKKIIFIVAYKEVM